jgi:hypothetical protein
MGDLFVMRRANGDLFTKEVEGRLVLPVWSGNDSVERFKERNPELLIYFAAPLDRKTLKRVNSGEHPTELFLVEDSDPVALLTFGRQISPDEIMPVGTQPAEVSPVVA